MHICLDGYEKLALSIGGSRDYSSVEEAYNQWVSEHKMFSLVLPSLPNEEIVRHLYRGRKWKKLLTEEEYRVIFLRFGLGSGPLYMQYSSFKEISAEIGITPRQAKAIAARAIRKLQRFFKIAF